jgi:hypothetical protein
MTVNQLALASSGRRSAALTATGLVGIGYTLSWIAGLSVPAPSPSFTATDPQIAAALAGHGPAVALSFALTEGLPAIGIAVVSVALARAARSRLALITGLTAAAISVVMFALGLVMAAGTHPALFHVIDRADGVKMLLLAVLGIAGACAAVLPRWLRYAGAALGVSIGVSGIAYLFLLPGLSAATAAGLVFLLVFITGSGLVLGKTR